MEKKIKAILDPNCGTFSCKVLIYSEKFSPLLLQRHKKLIESR